MALFLLDFGKYTGKDIKWIFENDIKYFLALEKTSNFKKFPVKVKTQYKKLKETRDEKGKPLTKNKIAKENKELLVPLVDYVFDSLQKKVPIVQIQDHLIQNGLDLEKSKELIKKTAILLVENKKKDRESTIMLHYKRYDTIYNKVANRNYEMMDDPFKRLRKEYEQRIQLMEILLAKEKLMGFHTKKFRVLINNKIQDKKLVEKPDIDFTRLSLEEKLELNSLYEKIFTEKTEVVIKVKNDAIQDVEFEDVKIEDVIEAPVTEVIETNESSLKEEEGKTLLEVGKEIKKTLEEKIKEMYNKKSF